jgi:hypothetical protein
MKIAVELIEAPWYKQQMFGIPVEGLTNVFCDNEAVTKNAIYLCNCLSLSKGSHRCWDNLYDKEDGKTNLANVLTKLLLQVAKEFLCDNFMY